MSIQALVAGCTITFILGIFLGAILERDINPYGNGHNSILRDCEASLPRDEFCKFELKAIPAGKKNAT